MRTRRRAPAASASRPAYLGETVYDAMRRAIVEGELDAGEPLAEHELSRRFGVSRTPIREALAKLERDRLVRVVPKKGAFVRTLSHDEVRELYQVREALEALAVRLAAPRVDKEQLAGFDARFRALLARRGGIDHAEVRVLGDEFHRFLAKQSGNARLVELLDQVREPIRAVWTMSVVAPRRAQGLVREHLALIDALRRGDGPRAERLMIAHVRRVRETIFRLLD